MLFNSHIFVFVFLPVTLAGFFAIGRFNAKAAAAWLVLASVFFYGWWQPISVVLLLSSVLFNYAIGVDLARTQSGDKYRRRMFTAAIAANLGLLAYFKYADFIVESLAPLIRLQPPEISSPLGISFFTFTQIAFLADVYRRQARDYDPIHYGLFVSYFPHLIAGPILHHREMMPQFARREIYRPRAADLAIGLTVFAIGLFKKVIIADAVAAPHANAVFAAIAQGNALPLLESWIGATAFGLQIYFDFSGYSDMAIGMSLLFGIRLPLNFNSPYKAESIIDFWRRWHITLSRFLRDYLYFPLGGNRHGRIARYRNLLLTMLIGGLWHGASWHFVAWGGLHGCFLAVNHLFRERHGARSVARTGAVRRCANWLLTFALVTLSWAFFRADSLGSALLLVEGMSGVHGVILPSAWWPLTGPPGGGYRTGVGAMLVIAGLVAFVRLAPNTQEIMQRFDIALESRVQAGGAHCWYHWRLTPLSAVAIALLLALSIAKFNDVTPFLYFQF